MSARDQWRFKRQKMEIIVRKPWLRNDSWRMGDEDDYYSYLGSFRGTPNHPRSCGKYFRQPAAEPDIWHQDWIIFFEFENHGDLWIPHFKKPHIISFPSYGLWIASTGNQWKPWFSPTRVPEPLANHLGFATTAISAQTAATQKPINLLDLITLSVSLKNRVKKVLGYGDLEVPELRGFCFFGCGRGLNQLLPMGANIGTIGQTAVIFFLHALEAMHQGS